MTPRNAAALVVLQCIFAASTHVAAAASCTAPAGGRIVLQSDAVDPDVFLWDSRTQLVDYAAGQWGNTRSIFAHTLLARPGTQALVVSCVAGVAHPKFGTGDEDAVGVKIVNGRYKGRFGWVLSSDTHVRGGATEQRPAVNGAKNLKR